MRILLLTHYYAPEYGAPQRRWGAFVRRFVAVGHEVEIIAPTPHYPEGRPTAAQRRRHRPGTRERGAGGERILRTAYLRHGSDILTRSLDHAVAGGDALRRLWSRSPAERPDVLIATAPAIASLLVGNILAARWRVPLVVEMRDAWPDLVAHVALAGPRRRGPLPTIVGYLKRRVHDRVTGWQAGSAAVVTTTERFARVLRDRGVGEVEVVRNGTDLGRIPLQEPHPVEEQRPLRCLYLGNMGRSQGLELVIDAAARLAHEGVPLEVRMIGHGVHAEALRRRADAQQAPVTVLPRIPHAAVAAHYAWADTVIASLRDWKPFEWTVPSKLYELLATGRHVTGILAGEAADVLEEAGAGDVVPPGDLEALCRLWRELAEDPTRRAGSDSGRVWVARHTEDDLLAARYLDLLEEIVDDDRPPAAGGPAAR